MTDYERKVKLTDLLGNALPKEKETILKNFDRMSFRSDEDFNTYLAETSAYMDFKKESKDQNAGVSPVIKDWLKSKDPNTVNEFAGKDIDGISQPSKQRTATGELSGREV